MILAIAITAQTAIVAAALCILYGGFLIEYNKPIVATDYPTSWGVPA